MTIAHRVLLSLLLVPALTLDACTEPNDTSEPEAAASPCEPVVYEDSSFTHCVADPAEHRIAMALGDPPWRSLAAYAADRPADAPPVAFAMNAGMFDEAGQPIGYYVEGGERLHSLNRNEGPGNFHLLPNGVFFGEDGEWRVMTTGDFYRTVDHRPAFGTQSGPMLVIGGELHPEIDPDGTSLRTRNAVGVDRQGRAHFVITEAPVSFGKLARYYRDVLKTPDALFLDGSVSQLWDPASGRLDAGAPIGPIVVVEQRARSRPRAAQK